MIDTSQSTWDSEDCEGVATVYYCGNPPFGRPPLRTVSFPVDEDYKTIGRKNLMAFEWALGLSWDYMARVNASCYVHKRRLRDSLQHAQDSRLIRCAVTDPTPACGVNRRWAWGGGQFIFSRDVVEDIVTARHLWNHNVMEDVAISEMANDLGIPIDEKGARWSSIDAVGPGKWNALSYQSAVPSFEFADFRDVAKLHDQFFIRVKHDPDRGVDAEVMRQLKRHLTP